MQEKEFEILDELYFVISFDELEEVSAMDRKELVKVLIALWENGWIRCYFGLDNELDSGKADIKYQFNKYHYLASKEGLMAHNSR
ncbi:MAG: hypothetical protein O6848_06335 [Bacteroidetes bacterium]|nr:hypothetical protein [Bacteroidota bacterium]